MSKAVFTKNGNSVLHQGMIMLKKKIPCFFLNITCVRSCLRTAPIDIFLLKREKALFPVWMILTDSLVKSMAVEVFDLQ